MHPYIMALDQGTSSSRAIIYDAQLRRCAVGRVPIAAHYPQSGWVEQSARDIVESIVKAGNLAISQAKISPADIAAIGITNQRETSILWQRDTGNAIAPAIVWQDRRTTECCDRMKAEGYEEDIQDRTGLLLDPYFSATKIAWLLDHGDGIRQRAADGKLAFGTVDSYLLWHLTDGKTHATDATNASRTSLYDIRRHGWSDELSTLFHVPTAVLPQVHDCTYAFGHCAKRFFGADIPILAMIGDQQSAMVGQGCMHPASVKATFGTGAFILLNTGDKPARSRNKLLTTIAYQLNGRTSYALEGAIFIAGAAVQWLRDALGFITSPSDVDELARRAVNTKGVYMIPAFVGLGAPHWRPQARGALFGLTQATGRNEIVRATLESIAYQCRDLLDAMANEPDSTRPALLRVDGGLSASDWTMQCLADICQQQVERPEELETTAKGAAYLAGLNAGIYPPPETYMQSWRAADVFSPHMSRDTADQRHHGWTTTLTRLS